MAVANETRSARFHPSRAGARAGIGAAAWPVVVASVMAMAVVTLAGCEQKRPPRRVMLGLSWVHQAQFSGPYHADQHGLYAGAGLRVDLVPASASLDPLDEFLAGKYDFVIAQPDLLIRAREKGHRLKAVAATYRVQPLVFLALQSSGIERPQDFRGKTIGVAYSQKLPLLAMLRKLDIDPGEVTMAQRAYGLDGLRAGKFDVEAAWVINEVIEARKTDLAVNIISPYDYGITFYADVLVARESLIERDPALVQAFVRATTRGWAEALQRPQAAAMLSLKYDPKLDPDHQREIINGSAPLVHTGADRIGWMRAEDWAVMIDTLYEEGMIAERPAVDDMFTTRFLEAPP